MGAVLAFTKTVELEVTSCCQCGVEFGVPIDMLKELRRAHKGFFCPNGHSLVFKGETEAERLTRELAAVQKQRDDARKRAHDAELSTRLTRGKLNALKGRVKNGVCPCCQRSFVQLARHMATKHPTYKTETEDQT